METLRGDCRKAGEILRQAQNYSHNPYVGFTFCLVKSLIFYG